MSEYEPMFIIFDKFIDLMEYLYNYYNKKDEREVNIELGNLYTIEEEDEEDEEVDIMDFILV
jgi:hypothetical protein